MVPPPGWSPEPSLRPRLQDRPSVRPRLGVCRLGCLCPLCRRVGYQSPQPGSGYLLCFSSGRSRHGSGGADAEEEGILTEILHILKLGLLDLKLYTL